MRKLLPDRRYRSRIRLPAKRTGKSVTIVTLAFFLFFPYPSSSEGQEIPVSTGISRNFPVISRIDSRDTGFRQYISDVENNRRRLVSVRGLTPAQAAEYLTIYQYTTRQGDDLFSVAARCNIPYSALASLNRINSSTALETGKTILLPSCPGIFVPLSLDSDIEKLTGATRLENEESVELKITVAGKSETFYFFPGADYTQTERTFFLNPGFRFPLRNFRITSVYGIRENPVTGNIVMHQGLDLAAPLGTEVYAVAEGTVTEIGEDPVYGIYIIITHQNRLSSLYGHLQKVETDLLSEVRSSSLIGRVGTTGQSTGPHLHFELRQDGRPIDPSGRLRR